MIVWCGSLIKSNSKIKKSKKLSFNWRLYVLNSRLMKKCGFCRLITNSSRFGLKRLAKIKFVESLQAIHLLILEDRVKRTETLLNLSRFSFGIYNSKAYHLLLYISRFLFWNSIRVSLLCLVWFDWRKLIYLIIIFSFRSSH